MNRNLIRDSSFLQNARNMLSRAITSLPSIDNLRFVIELVIEERTNNGNATYEGRWYEDREGWWLDGAWENTQGRAFGAYRWIALKSASVGSVGRQYRGYSRAIEVFEASHSPAVVRSSTKLRGDERKKQKQTALSCSDPHIFLPPPAPAAAALRPFSTDRMPNFSEYFFSLSYVAMTPAVRARQPPSRPGREGKVAERNKTFRLLSQLCNDATQRLRSSHARTLDVRSSVIPTELSRLKISYRLLSPLLYVWNFNWIWR